MEHTARASLVNKEHSGSKETAEFNPKWVPPLKSTRVEWGFAPALMLSSGHARRQAAMRSSCLARSQASALQPRACVRAAPTAQLSGLQALSHALSKLCGRRACAPLSAKSEDEPGRSEEGNNAVAPP